MIQAFTSRMNNVLTFFWTIFHEKTSEEQKSHHSHWSNRKPNSLCFSSIPRFVQSKLESRAGRIPVRPSFYHSWISWIKNWSFQTKNSSCYSIISFSHCISRITGVRTTRIHRTGSRGLRYTISPLMDLDVGLYHSNSIYYNRSNNLLWKTMD